MKRGDPRIDFKVAVATVANGHCGTMSARDWLWQWLLLEVFNTLLPGGVRYTGIDYSEAMIARARARYPLFSFDIGDATKLPYGDRAFDVVFNGVSLLHIVDYQAAVRKAARVALHHYCIFHTVPVHQHRTTFLSKYAYGGRVAEIIFDKGELMSLCRNAGLRLEGEWSCIPYDVFEVTGYHSTTETYLFSKV